MIGGFTNDINGAAPAAVCSLIVLVELATFRYSEG
jgi:hypothetical protein